MNCKDVKELLNEYIKDELSLVMRESVKAHIDGCDACKKELEELTALQNNLRATLKAAAGEALPPSGSLAIIKERAGMESAPVKNGFWSRMPALGGVALSLLVAFTTLVSFMTFSVGAESAPPPDAPILVSDGDGGVYMYWRTGNYEYEQYIDADGNLLWGEDGRDITGGTPGFDLPEIEDRCDSDAVITIAGDDGSYIYIIYSEGVLYVSKTDEDGNSLWASSLLINPNPIFDTTNYFCIVAYPDPVFNTIGYFSAISDGEGGVIIVTRVGDDRSRSNTHSVYAQHIDSEGNLLWGESGMVIQSVPSAPTALIIAGVSLIISVMVIIGLIRGNKAAQISTPVISLGLFFVAMYCVNLMYGTFGNNVYEWSYVLNTPLNWVAIWGIIICGLVLAVLGAKKAKLNKWIMIPVFVPYVLWAAVCVLWICLSNF